MTICLCEGLPLALRIAGQRLAGRPRWPVRTLVDQLGGEGRLDRLRYEDLSVRDCLVGGYDTVREEDEMAGRVFRLFGELSSAQLLAADAAVRPVVPPHRAGQALEGLVDAHLAGCPGRRRTP